MTTLLERSVARSPWLWVDEHGTISCGAAACAHTTAGAVWHALNPLELAELGALAHARRTTLRCRCGAVEYNPASRTVREAVERKEAR